jgi:hypothetical protein
MLKYNLINKTLIKVPSVILTDHPFSSATTYSLPLQLVFMSRRRLIPYTVRSRHGVVIRAAVIQEFAESSRRIALSLPIHDLTLTLAGLGNRTLPRQNALGPVALNYFRCKIFVE